MARNRGWKKNTAAYCMKYVCLPDPVHGAPNPLAPNNLLRSVLALQPRNRQGQTQPAYPPGLFRPGSPRYSGERGLWSSLTLGLPPCVGSALGNLPGLPLDYVQRKSWKDFAL